MRCSNSSLKCVPSSFAIARRKGCNTRTSCRRKTTHHPEWGEAGKVRSALQSREQAEARLTSLGYRWEWLPDGCLRVTTPVLPGVREISPGRKTFFNQLIAAYSGWKDTRNDPSKAIRFGNGESLDADAVKLAAELAEKLTFNVPWQTGDVVLLDNLVAMHGRRTFSGKRKVLASLASPESHAMPCRS